MTRHDAAALGLSVDRASPVPLYFQLSQKLEEAIGQGRLPPGSLLGNEIELASRLGLSRPTVRQAIQLLVEKGVLIRRRGVGTQVVHSRIRRVLELSSLYEDLEAAGQSPATRVLCLEEVPAPPEVAAALNLEAGEPVHHVERLRLTHGEPIARLCNHLPRDVLQPREAELAATGLYRLLRDAGVVLHSAGQRIGARAATAAEAALLHEDDGAPLLTMERTAYDETGRAVEYGTHLYRASRHSFELRLLARR
ncbi:GntR family transcriptional regulator [Streptomyces bohaiensis]|uniref:GntR family transcriptional regulator n=1 Tax=Streptomyces bohaiensis TaxID=1431344 RepID=A0ABX1CCV6_9ACTN|nr:GntR family transcriptional regulator [Streptomyces bohaiensis]NJQ15963.1 GntR family transcriptional regulator [Streptomyces bohaiensis]